MRGLGGQGVVTAAKIFSEAVGIVENRFAQAIPAYGHERRGAPVYADVIIDACPIKSKSFVYTPNYVILFDVAVVEKGVDIMAGTDEKTVFIVNAASLDESMPFRNHRTYFVDAHRISFETIKRDIPNAAMLGAMAGAGLVKIESVKASIDKTFKSGTLNAEAAQRAYDQLQEAVPLHRESPGTEKRFLNTLHSERPPRSGSMSSGEPETRKYLLGPVATVFASTNTGSWRNVRPVVNLQECSFCQICEKYCPVDTVTVTRSAPRKDISFDYAYCKGCGICANVCPKRCIAMVPERGE